MRSRARPLAPRTRLTYERLLSRAFGGAGVPGRFQSDPKRWPEGCKALLRAAVRWRCAERSVDPEPFLREVPRQYQVRREVVIPDEDEALAYERAAELLPRGKHALALLALKLGFRAEELCGLSREAVQRAVKTGDLIFVRKGGKEQLFKVGKVQGLLAELLGTPPKMPRRLGARRPRVWQRAGEILSAGGPRSQYNALHALVRDTGKAAGLKLRPHLLRHAFATRLARDGANLFVIQRALNHASIQTTQRYVHPDADDIARFTRA